MYSSQGKPRKQSSHTKKPLKRNFLFILLLYTCISASESFFLTEIFFHLVWCQGCRRETAAGAYLPGSGCVKHYLFHYALLCHIIFIFTFLFFFATCISSRPSPGSRSWGGAVVVIVRIKTNPDPDRDNCLLYICRSAIFVILPSGK